MAQTLNIWGIDEDITFDLFLTDATIGNGLPDQDGYVDLNVKRASDGYFYNSDTPGWQETVYSLSVTELDATDQPGMYVFVLPAAANDQEDKYTFFVSISNPPIIEGESAETHISKDTIVRLYESGAV